MRATIAAFALLIWSATTAISAEFPVTTSTIEVESSVAPEVGQGYESTRGLFLSRSRAVDCQLTKTIAYGKSTARSAERPELSPSHSRNGSAEGTDNADANGLPDEYDKQKITYEFSFKSNYAQLAKSLNASASVDIGIGAFGASAYASLSKSLDRSNASSYILFKMRVENADKIVQDCDVVADAKAKLGNSIAGEAWTRNGHPEFGFAEFTQFYGDEYVRSVTTGGELLAVFQISGESVEERERFAANMSASYGGYASASGSIRTEELNKTGELDISIHYMKRGGDQEILLFKEGKPIIQSGSDGKQVVDAAVSTYLRNMWAAAEKFPEEVARHSVVLTAHTISYNSLPGEMAEFPTAFYGRLLVEDFVNFVAANNKNLNDYLKASGFGGEQYCFAAVYGSSCVPVMVRTYLPNDSQIVNQCLAQFGEKGPLSQLDSTAPDYNTRVLELCDIPGLKPEDATPAGKMHSALAGLTFFTDLADDVFRLSTNPFITFDEWRRLDHRLSIFKGTALAVLTPVPGGEDSALGEDAGE